MAVNAAIQVTGCRLQDNSFEKSMYQRQIILEKNSPQTYSRPGGRWIDCRQVARKDELRWRERVAF